MTVSQIASKSVVSFQSDEVLKINQTNYCPGYCINWEKRCYLKTTTKMQKKDDFSISYKEPSHINQTLYPKVKERQYEKSYKKK